MSQHFLGPPYLETRIFKNQISPMFWGFDNTSQYLYVKWVQNPLTFCFCLFLNLDHSSGQVCLQIFHSKWLLFECPSSLELSLCPALFRALPQDLSNNNSKALSQVSLKLSLNTKDSSSLWSSLWRAVSSALLSSRTFYVETRLELQESKKVKGNNTQTEIQHSVS